MWGLSGLGRIWVVMVGVFERLIWVGFEVCRIVQIFMGGVSGSPLKRLLSFGLSTRTYEEDLGTSTGHALMHPISKDVKKTSYLDY